MPLEQKDHHEVITINSKASSNQGKTKLITTVCLLSIFLLLSFGPPARSAEVQTPSKMVKIGYNTVARAMKGIKSYEVDKKEKLSEALETLHEAIAEHLEEKKVPEHVVKRFSEGFESLEVLYESGAITREQLSSEANNLVKEVGREDKSGNIPTKVLEKAGISKNEAVKLQQQNAQEENMTNAVRNLVKEDEDRGPPENVGPSEKSSQAEEVKKEAETSSKGKGKDEGEKEVDKKDKKESAQKADQTVSSSKDEKANEVPKKDEKQKDIENKPEKKSSSEKSSESKKEKEVQSKKKKQVKEEKTEKEDTSKENSSENDTLKEKRNKKDKPEVTKEKDTSSSEEKEESSGESQKKKEETSKLEKEKNEQQNKEKVKEKAESKEKVKEKDEEEGEEKE